MRTRLLWFTAGASVSAAIIAQFAWKDLLAHRNSISSDAKQKFDALETRVANLESMPHQNLNPPQLYEERSGSNRLEESSWINHASAKLRTSLNHDIQSRNMNESMKFDLSNCGHAKSLTWMPNERDTSFMELSKKLNNVITRAGVLVSVHIPDQEFTFITRKVERDFCVS